MTMNGISEPSPVLPNLATDDEQDFDGDLTKMERGILPQAQQEPISNKDGVEKLARFFSDLPCPDIAKQCFFGFLTQLHQYGFYDRDDLPLLLLFYDKSEGAYVNSVPSWEWTHHHTLLLDNIRVMFYALIRQSIGTDKDIMNQRISLNAMRIQRVFGESGGSKREKFLGLI